MNIGGSELAACAHLYQFWRELSNSWRDMSKTAIQGCITLQLKESQRRQVNDVHKANITAAG
jgi:hypothetical protein